MANYFNEFKSSQSELAIAKKESGSDRQHAKQWGQFGKRLPRCTK